MLKEEKRKRIAKEFIKTELKFPYSLTLWRNYKTMTNGSNDAKGFDVYVGSLFIETPIVTFIAVVEQPNEIKEIIDSLDLSDYKIKKFKDFTVLYTNSYHHPW